MADCARSDFGLTLGEIVNDIGGGTLSGRPVRAVQVGGPLGAYVPVSLFDTPFDYEAFTKATASSATAGSWCSTIRSTWPGWRASAWSSARSRAAANARPAASDRRAASRRSTRSAPATNVDANIELLKDLCQTMKFGSLCALGGFAPYPVESALRHFPEDFHKPALEAAAE